MSTASTGVPAQSGGAQAPSLRVLVLRDRGARPVVVNLSPSDFVAQLAKAARDGLELKVPADYVVLKLAVDDHELDSNVTLAAAGVVDGTRVIATAVAPPQPATTAAAGASRKGGGGGRGMVLGTVHGGRARPGVLPTPPSFLLRVAPYHFAGGDGSGGIVGGVRADFNVALNRLQDLLRRNLSPSEKDAFARAELKADREDLANNVPFAPPALERLVERLKTVVTTRKRLQIATATGYYFDGQLSSSEGRARPCILYRVVTPAGRVGVAKVYFATEAAAAHKEWELSRALAPSEMRAAGDVAAAATSAATREHDATTAAAPQQLPLGGTHPLVHYEARLELDNNRVALCMPLFACTLHDLLREAHGGHTLPASLLLRVADAMEAALSLLHGYNIAHCDVKPDNIMLRESGEPVLIDLGSATPFGQEIEEGAPLQFILDCDTTAATPLLDRVCLATTLWAAMHHGVAPAAKSRQRLTDVCRARAAAEAGDTRALLERIAALLLPK
jgi:hypothetical protein